MAWRTRPPTADRDDDTAATPADAASTIPTEHASTARPGHSSTLAPVRTSTPKPDEAPTRDPARISTRAHSERSWTSGPPGSSATEPARTSTAPAAVGNPAIAPAGAPVAAEVPDAVRIIHLPRVRAVAPVDDAAAEAAGTGPPEPRPAPFLSGAHRVAFFSLKGGVGKTTLAVETAAHLARNGHWRESPSGPRAPLRVALLDLDTRSANAAMRLGLTHPTLWDLVISPDPGGEEIESCLLTERSSGLRALLGPPRSVSNAEGRALVIARVARILSHLDDAGYHVVCMDLGSEVDQLTTYVLEAAHRICYVVTPTASSVQDAYRGAETIRRLGHRRKLRFVLNQVRGSFDSTEMMADLGGALDARVRFDEAFLTAENRHLPGCLDGHDTTGIATLARSIHPALATPAAGARSGLWRRLRARLA